jgi:hypothetical protein
MRKIKIKIKIKVKYPTLAKRGLGWGTLQIFYCATD